MNEPTQRLDLSPLPQTVEQAKDAVLKRMKGLAMGLSIQRDKEVVDALIAACRAEQDAEIARICAENHKLCDMVTEQSVRADTLADQLSETEAKLADAQAEITRLRQVASPSSEHP